MQKCNGAPDQARPFSCKGANMTENTISRRSYNHTAPGTHFLDQNGHEVLDPTPMAPPVGFIQQPSMFEHIRNLVRTELSRRAAETGELESFEEADDFDIGDDYDPTSPYEVQFEGLAPAPETGVRGGAPSKPSGTPTDSEEPAGEAPEPSSAAPSEKPPRAPRKA